MILETLHALEYIRPFFQFLKNYFYVQKKVYFLVNNLLTVVGLFIVRLKVYIIIFSSIK